MKKLIIIVSFFGISSAMLRTTIIFPAFKSTPYKCRAYMKKSCDVTKCKTSNWAEDSGFRSCKNLVDCHARLLHGLERLKEVRRKQLSHSVSSVSEEWYDMMEIAGCGDNIRFINSIAKTHDFFDEKNSSLERMIAICNVHHKHLQKEQEKVKDLSVGESKEGNR